MDEVGGAATGPTPVEVFGGGYFILGWVVGLGGGGAGRWDAVGGAEVRWGGYMR